MKKILLGLFFAMFAMQVSAATLNWTGTTATTYGAVPSSTEINAAANFVGPAASASYDFTFEVLGGSLVATSLVTEFVATDFSVSSVAISGTGITGNNYFTDLGVVGRLQSWSLSPALLLTTGNYTITAIMEVMAPGNFNINVSSVPVPAAVWLFGSALMGLFGVSRRKSTAVAA